MWNVDIHCTSIMFNAHIKKALLIFAVYKAIIANVQYHTFYTVINIRDLFILKTCFFFCIQKCTVEILMEGEGENAIDVKDKFGFYPIHYAVQINRPDIARVLVHSVSTQNQTSVLVSNIKPLKGVHQTTRQSDNSSVRTTRRLRRPFGQIETTHVSTVELSQPFSCPNGRVVRRTSCLTSLWASTHLLISTVDFFVLSSL